MNKDRVVISGINGFVGHHLARELYKSDVSVIGVSQDAAISDSLKDCVDEYYQAELTEAWPEIKNVKAVIHLAGLAAVGPSFDNPQLYINANSSMVTHLCEYYIKQDDKPRVVIVSSGAIYSSEQPMPINETSSIGLSSPYAVSKVLNENQATYYRSRGLDCVVVRPFNHIGPGQNVGFILPDFYERLSQLKDSENTIQTGNIETRRDYTDVRDIVRAYRKIALTPTLQHNLYNVCSGKSLSGADIFNKLKEALKLENVGYKIDQSLIRPTDVMNIVGDASLLNDDLEWHPEISIDQTIEDFVKSKQQ